MRNMKLHTICILALATTVSIGIEASAQLDPNMEARVDCSSANCMFRGNSQTRDAVAGLSKLPVDGGVRLIKVNRFADNPDYSVDRARETQFAPVGQISLKEFKTAEGGTAKDVATGFLVSPCYAFTNQHVVLGNDIRPQAGSNYEVKFSVGTDSKYPFALGTMAHPVLWGNMDARGNNDWVLLKLNSCLGKRPGIGWMEVSTKKASQIVGENLAIAAFSADAAVGELRVAKGRATRLSSFNNNIEFAASTAHGTSGGPILNSEDGKVKVVGINVGAADDNNGKADFATFSDRAANAFQSIQDAMKRPDVEQLINEDILKYGQTNPAEQALKRSIPARSTQMASAI